MFSKQYSSPSVINIYAIESPQEGTLFAWEGKLPLAEEYESLDVESGKGYIHTYVGSGTLLKDIKAVAENFSYNCIKHRNPNYLLKFEPPQKEIKMFEEKHDKGGVKRKLTPEEQKIFLEAFQKANESAARWQKYNRSKH